MSGIIVLRNKLAKELDDEPSANYDAAYARVQPPRRRAQREELGNWLGNMQTVEEYMALETTKTAANFEGISKAKASKPRRQQTGDVEVAEAPVLRERAEDSGAGAAARPANTPHLCLAWLWRAATPVRCSEGTPPRWAAPRASPGPMAALCPL